jgi:hypothetical protein
MRGANKAERGRCEEQVAEGVFGFHALRDGSDVMQGVMVGLGFAEKSAYDYS